MGRSDSLIVSGTATAAARRPARMHGVMMIEAVTPSEKAQRTLGSVRIAFASSLSSSVSVLKYSISSLPSGKEGLVDSTWTESPVDAPSEVFS